MNTRGNRGSFLESLIISSQVGVVLEKVPTGAKILKIAGKTMVVPIKTLPDFVGAVTFAGPMRNQALIFDAKECQNPRRLELGEAKMSLDQRKVLMRWATRARSIAGVLAHASAHRELYWIDAEHLLPVVPSYLWQDPRLIPLGFSTSTVNFQRLIDLKTPCD